jgi:hypothetical protein
MLRRMTDRGNLMGGVSSSGMEFVSFVRTKTEGRIILVSLQEESIAIEFFFIFPVTVKTIFKQNIIWLKDVRL